jgi:hypothetical protein
VTILFLGCASDTRSSVPCGFHRRAELPIQLSRKPTQLVSTAPAD